MFGKKRQKNINIVNPVFGELEYRNSMYHGTTQITLWHKRFDIKVFPVTNSNRITSYNVCYTKLLR